MVDFDEAPLDEKDGSADEGDGEETAEVKKKQAVGRATQNLMASHGPEAIYSADDRPPEATEAMCMQKPYLEAIGNVMYASVVIRPDISHAIPTLTISQQPQLPTARLKSS